MTHNRFDPDRLPAAIRHYLETPRGTRLPAETLASIFTPDARVVDERTEFSGLDAIAGWFLDAGSEYSYTTTYLVQTVTASDHWTVTAQLEGDFPGGQADLRYRFRIEDHRIAELVIAP